MINIGKLTVFSTTNFTKNFFHLKNNQDLDFFLDKKLNLLNGFFFGGGSNLLFSKDVFDDQLFFVKNDIRGIKYLGDQTFSVSAGENLSFFVQYLNKNHNIAVLNPLFGLPGSVGGAVVGNAGCFGTEIGNFVKQIRYIDDSGNIIKTSDYSFGYRTSNLKNRKILLLDILFQIKTSNDNKFEEPVYYAKRRAQNQDYGKTCGSYFKNYNLSILDNNFDNIFAKIKAYDSQNKIIPADFDFSNKSLKIPAGWLIDKSGLKGYSFGGVVVSQKHANFIINQNNEKSSNILKLADIIKQKVYEKFNIVLEEEVVIF